MQVGSDLSEGLGRSRVEVFEVTNYRKTDRDEQDADDNDSCISNSPWVTIDGENH